MRSLKRQVTRPYVIFHPNLTLHNAGFHKHIIAHIYNVQTTLDCPSGKMNLDTICQVTNDGYDLGFDTKLALIQYMSLSKITYAYLYPLKFPKEESIIWSSDKKLTAVYNQNFLTPSYCPRQTSPINPHPWLFWFPEKPPGNNHNFRPLHALICLFLPRATPSTFHSTRRPFCPQCHINRRKQQKTKRKSRNRHKQSIVVQQKVKKKRPTRHYHSPSSGSLGPCPSPLTA